MLLTKKISTSILLGWLILMLSACGGTSGPELTLSDIPIFPDAKEAASMLPTDMAGMKGNLKQYSSSASYDDVVNFYINALQTYQTHVVGHTSELGRQAAISIRKAKGGLSVAIQELAAENTVHITLMEVTN